MTFRWPPGVPRVPDEDWTRQPLGDLALKYDSVDKHGWYENLDPTVDRLSAILREGDLVVDYSGGTGILTARLLERLGERKVGVLVVDSSPKFLRLALDKLGGDERVGFRLIEFLKERKRLELLDEVLGPELVARRADALVSTNAIHLYYDLPETLASWARCLRPGGWVHVQSGNVDNPDMPAGQWIIDATVEAIADAAATLVAEDERFARFRDALADPRRMEAHAAVRRKFFLPVRPLSHYVGALEAAGLRVDDVATRSIEARVTEWYDFLAVYHEGVIGWAGGSERVEGRAPDDATVALRLDLLRAAMARVFHGRPTFTCCWTYVNARRE